MKKNIYKVLVASIALLVIPTSIYFTQELQKDELQASVGGMKTTVNQYERIKMGGKSFTALSPTSFLVDVGMGPYSGSSYPMIWTSSLDNSKNNGFITGTSFSKKEIGTIGSFILNSRIPSKADLPIEGNVLNSNIPNHDNNWWLMDELTGDGNPRSFVNTSNQVDAGYNREVAANTGSTTCGKKTELFEGGLNTTAYTGPSPDGIEVIAFTYSGDGSAVVSPTEHPSVMLANISNSPQGIHSVELRDPNQIYTYEYLLGYHENGNDDPSCGTS